MKNTFQQDFSKESNKPSEVENDDLVKLSFDAERDHPREDMKNRIQNSKRVVDIFKNKLMENANQRGNIIFNSLGQHKRSFSKHQNTNMPVADPSVYRIIGKLH